VNGEHIFYFGNRILDEPGYLNPEPALRRNLVGTWDVGIRLGLVARPRNPGPAMLRPTAMAGLAVEAFEDYIGRQSCLPDRRCLWLN
jgi:hypothetical protein